MPIRNSYLLHQSSKYVNCHSFIIFYICIVEDEGGKESPYTSLSEISESLFIASIDILCCLENDMDSVILAQFMIDLHETVDAFIDIDCT